MTNEEKLKEIFPGTIFIRLMKENKTQALVVSDEWLNAEYLGYLSLSVFREKNQTLL